MRNSADVLLTIKNARVALKMTANDNAIVSMIAKCEPRQGGFIGIMHKADSRPRDGQRTAENDDCKLV